MTGCGTAIATLPLVARNDWMSGKAIASVYF